MDWRADASPRLSPSAGAALLACLGLLGAAAAQTQSSDSALSSLVLTNSAGETVPLMPTARAGEPAPPPSSFDPDRMAYTTIQPNGVTSVTVTAVARDPAATLSLVGLVGPFPSGEASSPIDLVAGETTPIAVGVRAEDGTESGYLVSVARAAWPSSAPAAPGNLRAIPGNGWLWLSWSAPSYDGGEPPSGYLLRWASSAAPTTWVNPGGANGADAGGADLLHIVAGLDNGTPYRVQVAAENSIGAGDWSEPLVATPVLDLRFASQQEALRFKVRDGALQRPVSLPAAQHGTPPYRYAIKGLPGGLQFDGSPEARTLSGTPQATAPVTVVYTVSDAASTIAVQTFTIVVLGDAALRSLRVEGNGGEQDITLAPAFDPDVKQYVARRSHALRSVRLVAAARDSRARLSLGGSGSSVPFVSGARSPAVNLLPDQRNDIPLLVRTRDGAASTYLVSIHRDAPPPRRLSIGRLVPGPGQLRVEWNALRPADGAQTPSLKYRVRWRVASAQFSSSALDRRRRAGAQGPNDNAPPDPLSVFTLIPDQPWQDSRGAACGHVDGVAIVRRIVDGQPIICDDGDLVPGGGSAASYSILGLDFDTRYEVQLAGESSGGLGEWSTSQVDAPSGQNAPPSAPREVLVNPGDGRLIVTWKPPATIGGTPIIAYRLWYRIATGDGRWSRARVDDGNRFIYPITGPVIRNGLTIQVRMHAINNVGVGAWSSTQSAVPGPDVRFASASQGALSYHAGVPIAGLTLSAAEDGTPPYSYAAVGLPDGLQLHPVTGVLSGTPLARTTSEYPVRYTVSDSRTPPGVAAQSFTVTVTTTLRLDDVPNELHFRFNDSTRYVALPKPTGGSPPYAYSLQGRVSGLRFDHAERRIFGWPREVGDTLMTYRVVDAVGDEATARFVIVVNAAPPAAPSGLQVSAANERLQLRWTPPLGVDAGGEPPTRYRVRWASGEAPTTWINPGGAVGMDIYAPGATHEITGLRNGTEYAVQVVAVNSAGAGEFTASVRGAPAETLAFKMPPGGLFLYAAGGVLVAPVILPEAERGSPPYSYSAIGLPSGLRFDSANRGIFGVVPRDTASFAIAYTVRDTSSAMLSKMLPVTVLGPPGAPNAVTISAGAGRLGVGWEAPYNTGGGGVRGYRVRWKLAAAESYGASEDVSGRSHAIADLARGETYDVQVAAINAAVIGRFSVAAQGTTVDFDLDVDDEMGTTVSDGIMIARYLLGAGENDLTAGMSGVLPGTIESKIAAGRDAGVLDVDDSDVADAVDGIMVLRYLMRVRGRALTAGLPINAFSVRVQNNILILRPR